MKDGFLLLHGKGSGPNYPTCAMNPVAAQMAAEGRLFYYKPYSWSVGEVFNHLYEETLQEVIDGIAALRAQGAERVHIVGHSIGANIALYSATKIANFDSMVLIAPAHNTHMDRFNQWSLWSRRKARALLDEGNNEPADFIDTSMMETYIVKCLPSGYLSYLAPDGNSNMVKNAKKITTRPNLLVVSGTADFTQVEVKRLIYDVIPKTEASKFIETADGHLDITMKTYTTWTQWCENLPT